VIVEGVDKGSFDLGVNNLVVGLEEISVVWWDVSQAHVVALAQVLYGLVPMGRPRRDAKQIRDILQVTWVRTHAYFGKP